LATKQNKSFKRAIKFKNKIHKCFIGENVDFVNA